MIQEAQPTPARSLSLLAQPKSALTALGLIVAPLLALLMWVTMLRGTDTRLISDFGLITALPPVAFGALFILIASFVVALNQAQLNGPILLLHVLVLIVCLYGAAILIEGETRTAVAWKLSGIMDQVMQHGSVDPSRDAFQNWPGFFILVAFFSSLAGLSSPLVLAAWAHVIFSLLYLGPLWLLFNAATSDRRIVWLSIWMFYLCNWIGQDYLAPQAFGYFFYLLTLGIVLVWFRGGSGIVQHLRPRLKFLPARLTSTVDQWFPPGAPVGPVAQLGRQQVGLLALITLFMVALAPSHQLSPVALLAGVVGLVIFGRISPRGLPLILGVLLVAFISYGTIPYLRGHIANFTEPLGSISSNVTANVSDRVRGSLAHVYVVRSRIVASLFIWLIAASGVIRRLRHGYRDTSFALLAAVPFGLLGLQKYGGELLLRTFLFSLPFVAFFMAALFWPRPDRKLSWPVSAGLVGLCAVLSVSFFLTRYGNERMDYFTPDEVAAVDYVYSQAQPGAQLVAGDESLPWRYQEYNDYHYETIERSVRTHDLPAVIAVMSQRRFSESYLILTRSQQAAAELYLGWEPGVWERFETSVTNSPDFELVYSNANAKVFVLANQAPNP